MLKRWNIIIRIIDGDAVDVLVNKTPVRMRLVDIDAPESKQSFRQKSRQFLADIIFRPSIVEPWK